MFVCLLTCFLFPLIARFRLSFCFQLLPVCSHFIFPLFPLPISVKLSVYLNIPSGINKAKMKKWSDVCPVVRKTIVQPGQSDWEDLQSFPLVSSHPPNLHSVWTSVRATVTDSDLWPPCGPSVTPVVSRQRCYIVSPPGAISVSALKRYSVHNKSREARWNLLQLKLSCYY